MLGRTILTIVLLSSAWTCEFVLAETSSVTSWPALRGPDATGVAADHPRLPNQWSAESNVAWKTDVDGRGWSSPIVWQDQVFLTTAINSGEAEAPKKGLYFGGDRNEPPQSEHIWKLICLDLQTGELRWQRILHQGIPATPMHIKNSYASETPVTDGQHVFAYMGNVGLYCYSLEGELVWKKTMPPKPISHDWGTAASPVLHENRLYVVSDTEEDSTLTAYDTQTGNQVWQVLRDEGSNWATPYVWQNSLRTEIVTPGSDRIRSYDLDGNLLYELGGASSITIATPYSQFGLLYVTSGYVLDKKKPIFAIRPGGSGDISLSAEETSNASIAWCQPKAAPYNPTTIVYGDYLYCLYDQGFLACYNAKTGEEVYSKQRLPNGRAFTSSPWAYDGKIFCVNEDGVTFVIQAGPEFQLLHTNALAEDDMCMATPAIADGKLLIRSAERIYCLTQQP
ncbi:MAG: PQQ-binding-like beta-propeller repeat protein [Pirellulaceae bacterium]